MYANHEWHEIVARAVINRVNWSYEGSIYGCSRDIIVYTVPDRWTLQDAEASARIVHAAGHVAIYGMVTAPWRPRLRLAILACTPAAYRRYRTFEGRFRAFRMWAASFAPIALLGILSGALYDNMPAWWGLAVCLGILGTISACVLHCLHPEPLRKIPLPTRPLHEPIPLGYWP